MTRPTKTTLFRATGVLAASVVVSLVAACSGPGMTTTSPRTGALSDSVIGSTIAKLPQKIVGKVPVTRLAHGLAPPTNRWFSGLVFGEHPLPVFPLPLSFGLTDTGFTFGLPEVTTTPNTITGGNAPSVTIDAGASTSKIVAYDDASVTIAHRSGSGSTLGSTVVAEGSPLVSFTAAKKLTLKLGQHFNPAGKGVYCQGRKDHLRTPHYRIGHEGRHRPQPSGWGHGSVVPRALRWLTFGGRRARGAGHRSDARPLERRLHRLDHARL